MNFVDVTSHFEISLFSCSIFQEERLERLTKNIGALDLEYSEGFGNEEILGDNLDGISLNCRTPEDMMDGTAEISESDLTDSMPGGIADNGTHLEHQIIEGHVQLLKKDVDDSVVIPIDSGTEVASDKVDSGGANLEDCDTDVDDFASNKQAGERRLPNAVRPLLRYYQYESSESSSRYIIAVLFP